MFLSFDDLQAKQFWILDFGLGLHSVERFWINPTDKGMGVENFKFSMMELFHATRGVSVSKR
ncbi:hypothetical protein [uncultured Nostoc sp.]|uniref:hypothetical protein n=1 Tax=uncultured Nostoc sp. TaxID=340711 RepID=UPI0035C97D02